MRVASRAAIQAFTTKDGSTIRELMHTPNQSLAEATLAPGQATERHFHALSEELYSFLEGGGRLEIDGEVRHVAAGDTVLIPPGARHTITAGTDGAQQQRKRAPPYSHADTYVD